MMTKRRARWLAALAAFVAAMFLMADVAEARGGRGGGFGSRGSRSAEPPPVTRTAPREAAPLQRQQDAGPTASSAQASRAAAPGAAQGQMAGRGGFMGGLLGAGLIGMLLGYGLFGGFAGLASLLGLMLQVAVIAGIVVLALRWFRSRGQPLPAGPAVPSRRQAQDVPPVRPTAGLGAGQRPRRRAGSDDVGIGQADFDAFEQVLVEVQTGYGRGDRAALRWLALPEVADRLERDLDADAARNVVNRVSDVKLLQGDLAEAWREDGGDYATVAMRFSLIDHVEDIGTGQVVEGDPGTPTEATEIWTFRRAKGERWQVSAIQQG